MTIFYLNDIATVSNTFSVGGVATDPDTVTLVITDPEGTATTYTYAGGEVSKVGTGEYSKDVTASIAGLWSYVWVGTGAVADVVSGTFTVTPTVLEQWYTSKEEVKTRLGITDTADDEQVLLAVASASSGINTFCRRHFYRVTDTRVFASQGIEICLTDDLVSVTTLKTDTTGNAVYDTTWASTDYRLEPPNARDPDGELAPYTRIRSMVGGGGGTNYFPYVWPLSNQQRVQITGVYGWPAVPFTVKQAAIQLAVEMFKLKDAPFGLQGFGEYGVVRIRQNPQIASMLSRYVRGRDKVGL